MALTAPQEIRLEALKLAQAHHKQALPNTTQEDKDVVLATAADFETFIDVGAD